MVTRPFLNMKNQLSRSNTNQILMILMSNLKSHHFDLLKVLDKNINITLMLKNPQLQWMIKAMNIQKLILSLFTNETQFKKKFKEELSENKKFHGELKKKFCLIENKSKVKSTLLYSKIVDKEIHLTQYPKLDKLEKQKSNKSQFLFLKSNLTETLPHLQFLNSNQNKNRRHRCLIEMCSNYHQTV